MNKYQNIYRKIQEKIQKKIFPPNTCLPSEKELTQEYHASRDTVRKALSLLVQNGYIQKSRGKGSIVLDVMSKIDFPVSGVRSFKELAQEISVPVKTIVIDCHKIELTQEFQNKMNLDQGELWKVQRVRQINHEKIILDLDYINAAVVKKITKKIAENSLYEYIENELNLVISFARKEITVVKATEREKELLDLGDFDSVVLVSSYVYLDDATLFQYTESRHRPDKFRFVDFARREQL